MTASALDLYLKRPFFIGFAMAEYQVALDADWEAGRPEEICEDDGGMGTIRSTEGYLGYVSTVDAHGQPLSAFRSMPKNSGKFYRRVYAKDPESRTWMVGMLRKETRWATEHGWTGGENG